MIGLIIASIGMLLFGFTAFNKSARSKYYRILFISLFVFAIYTASTNVDLTYYIPISYLVCFAIVQFLEYFIGHIEAWKSLRGIRSND